VGHFPNDLQWEIATWFAARLICAADMGGRLDFTEYFAPANRAQTLE